MAADTNGSLEAAERKAPSTVIPPMTVETACKIANGASARKPANAEAVRPSVAPADLARVEGRGQNDVPRGRRELQWEEAMRLATLVRGAALATLALCPISVAHAESPADFYKGKNVDLYIGYSAGGGYDVYARLLARHMGRFIPGNPTIVPKNMPGAGSLVLANWLYNVAARDGTAFGTIGRGTGFDPLLGSTKAQFDAAKFNWLGSMNDEVSVCVAWQTSGITKLEQVMQKELTVGGTGPAADTDQFPKVLNATINTKFKIIAGYPGGNDVDLAMERGEVMGRCGWSWSSVIATHKAWLDEKKINVLVQLSLSKHPDLPDVPLVMDFAKNDEEKQIFKLVFARQPMGRPFLAPPDVPADRIGALRKAFMDTMKDREFLAEAEKMKLEINPVSGDAVQKIVQEVYQTPKPVAAAVAEMVNH
jgi:tripartite-type tricarboxylate transporter receptor subunit TctC